ncbi:MAG: transporter substrate-binding domain-containing protein [Nocardioides sp.]
MARWVREDLTHQGTLRASINLGNPILAQGTQDAPRGVTVDIARELAARLDAPVQLLCFDAARKSFEALSSDAADIGFLAVDPAREQEIAFTAPYAIIEASFAVADSSSIRTIEDADRPGVRIGVKEGSAYDLFLTRHLQHATVVRGDDGIAVFVSEGLDVAAGLREPLHAYAEEHPQVRVVEPPFMQIFQALGVSRTRRDDTRRFLGVFVEELKANGFIAESLARSARNDAVVAPPVTY